MNKHTKQHQSTHNVTAAMLAQAGVDKNAAAKVLQAMEVTNHAVRCGTRSDMIQDNEGNWHKHAGRPYALYMADDSALRAFLGKQADKVIDISEKVEVLYDSSAHVGVEAKPEAKYGYKADGITPNAKPGRKPQAIATASKTTKPKDYQALALALAKVLAPHFK